jgi:DNA topoisomerase-1
MTQTLEKDMTQISEQKIKEDEVIEESRVMLTSVFDELSCNQEDIGQSLKDGLRTDKIVGTCEKCGSELIIRRGHRGSRFIGCSGYPECRFTLPLPRSGAVVVTDKVCEKHGMFHIRIINKGKRPWDLGCPHCNFLDWQAKKALELAEGKESGEGKGAKARPAKSATGAKVAKKASGPSNVKSDGLAGLPGIGPKTLEKLAAAGIKTSGELADANAKSLAAKTGLSEKKITAWKSAAKALS